MRSRLVLFALLTVVVLLGGAFVTGYFMPGHWRAEARTTIAATPAAIHARLADVRTWPAWFPWTTAKDPSIRYTFSGAPAGVGAVLAWESQNVGNGTLTITRSDPSQGIAYDLVFAGSRQPSHGEIALADAGTGATLVTWSDGGELGANPIARLFRAPIEGMLAKEFSESLARLKALAEAPPEVAPSPGPGKG
jgi:hypothetical protein